MDAMFGALVGRSLVKISVDKTTDTEEKPAFTVEALLERDKHIQGLKEKLKNHQQYYPEPKTMESAAPGQVPFRFPKVRSRTDHFRASPKIDKSVEIQGSFENAEDKDVPESNRTIHFFDEPPPLSATTHGRLKNQVDESDEEIEQIGEIQEYLTDVVRKKALLRKAQQARSPVTVVKRQQHEEMWLPEIYTSLSSPPISVSRNDLDDRRQLQLPARTFNPPPLPRSRNRMTGNDDSLLVKQSLNQGEDTVRKVHKDHILPPNEQIQPSHERTRHRDRARGTDRNQENHSRSSSLPSKAPTLLPPIRPNSSASPVSRSPSPVQPDSSNSLFSDTLSKKKKKKQARVVSSLRNMQDAKAEISSSSTIRTDTAPFLHTDVSPNKSYEEEEDTAVKEVEVLIVPSPLPASPQSSEKLAPKHHPPRPVTPNDVAHLPVRYDRPVTPSLLPSLLPPTRSEIGPTVELVDAIHLADQALLDKQAAKCQIRRGRQPQELADSFEHGNHDPTSEFYLSNGLIDEHVYDVAHVTMDKFNSRGHAFRRDGSSSGLDSPGLLASNHIQVKGKGDPRKYRKQSGLPNSPEGVDSSSQHQNTSSATVNKDTPQDVSSANTDQVERSKYQQEDVVSTQQSSSSSQNFLELEDEMTETSRISKANLQASIQHFMSDERVALDLQLQLMLQDVSNFVPLTHYHRAEANLTDPQQCMASSSTLTYLNHNSLLSPLKLAYFRSIFLKIDDDHDYVITPQQLFEGLKMVSRDRIGCTQFRYIMTVLDLVALDWKQAKATLKLKAGSFHDPKESLVLKLAFHVISFDEFVVLAMLTEKIVNLRGLANDAVNSLNPVLMRDLDKAKNLFLMHTGNTAKVISLEVLKIDLKCAGNFSLGQEEAIISAFRDRGIESLTFLDYLSYMPLFMGIHSHIVFSPF